MDNIEDTTDQPFVLGMPAAFWWPVKVPFPVDGEYKHATLQLQFEPVDQTTLDKFRGIGLAIDEGVTEEAPSDEAIARRVVVGWRALRDEAKNLVDFSAEALERLLAVPIVRSAIVATYMQVMLGMGARKNG